MKTSTNPEAVELAGRVMTCGMRLAFLALDYLSPSEVGRLTALRELGWSLAVEASAGHDGESVIFLTSIGPAGEREVFMRITGSEPATAH